MNQSSCGEPMYICAKCGQSYYSFAGHNCPKDMPVTFAYPSREDQILAELKEIKELLKQLIRERG